MAYLGNKPKNNLLTMNSSQYSGNNILTNFTLTQSVGNVNEIEVYVGNVRQDPFSAYSISGGTTLAFTAAPPTGTANIYVVFQGKSTGNIEPGANSIEAGMIKSPSFSLFSSSTRINILPFFASYKILLMLE